MAKKKRITLYVDEEIWDELTSQLKEKGYPRGVPSWIAQEAFEKTALSLQHIGRASQLDLFFDRKEK